MKKIWEKRATQLLAAVHPTAMLSIFYRSYTDEDQIHSIWNELLIFSTIDLVIKDKELMIHLIIKLTRKD